MMLAGKLSDKTEKFGELLLESNFFQHMLDYWAAIDKKFIGVGIETADRKVRDNIVGAYNNINNALLTLVNLTDALQASSVTQSIFDSIFPNLLTQLKSDLNLGCAKNLPGYNKGRSQYERYELLINIMLNFASNLESSLPTMRTEGVGDIMVKYRECVDSFDTKTQCLLVLGYLLGEDDDQGVIELANEELSFLIKSLETSLLRPMEYSPTELIQGLNRIAVKDSNKVKLIEQGYITLLKRSLLPQYDDRQKAAAARGLWNLAFSAESKKKILDEHGCFKSKCKI